MPIQHNHVEEQQARLDKMIDEFRARRQRRQEKLIAKSSATATARAADGNTPPGELN